MHSPPGTFDPATGRFTSGGPAVASQFNDLDRERRGEAGETMPLLGGHLLQRRIADGRTWLCGTHGLVVLRGTNNGPVAALPEIPFAPPPAPRAAPAAPLVSRTETPVPKVAVATPKLEPAATKVEAVIPKVQLPLPKPENTAPKPAPVASSALLRTNSPLAKMPVLAWEPNPAEEARNKVWGEEAKAMRINYGIPVTELRQWVAHTNRMVVAQALMRGVAEKERRSPAYFEVLGSLLADPEIRVRSSALFRLDQARPPEALVALRIGLRTVTNTHEHSILALLAAEKGDPLDLPSVEGLLRLGIEQHNYPVGIDSRSGIDVSRGRICSVLVASGRRDALELALQMPARVGRPWHGETNRTPAIVLRQHPEFLPLLLAASDRNAPHQFLFAHHLVWSAGREWLPQLHAAIAGSDPIQRANAIRACGRIKDPSSIPILRQLLETADAEQLVLVVWALGELRVREAVPRVLDILRARSATFGAASGDYQHAYGSLPGEGEPLRPPHFWVALSRMGPDLAPELFLELAGERDFSARFTAAEALATMPDAYRTRAVEALRGLTTGMWNGVIQRANVSLLAYDDPDARRTVQGWLGLPRTSAGLEILPQLARIPAEHRKFLEPSLQAFRADLPKFSDMVPLIDKLLSGDNTPGRPAPK